MLGQLGANTCHPPSTVSSHIFSSLYKSMPADHNHLHHYAIQRFKAQVACAYTWLSTCRCACQSSGHGDSVDDGVQSTSESSVAGFISYGDVWWFLYVGMNESRCRRWWNLVGGVFGVGLWFLIAEMTKFWAWGIWISRDGCKAWCVSMSW